MDEKGRVDGGSLYDPSDSSLLGKRLERKQVRSALDDTVAHFDVVLLDLSGVRVDPELDDVIAEAAEAVGSRRGTLVLLCALSPAYPAGDTRRIGFVVWRDFSRREPPTERLLTSASTRWRGIVSPADFAPTVLVQCIHPPPDAYARRAGGIEFFRQALYENMSGRPAEAVPSRAALSELDRLDLMLSERDRLRKTAALMWGICSLALAGVALLLDLRERKEVQWLAVPALAMALFPVGLLLAPLAGMGQARQLLVATGVAVGGALSAARLPRSSQSVGVPLLLGVGIIALDVVFGSPLMRQSPLGFSVLSGSRFYGIGNEYAGVMGAMITIGLGALLGARSPRVWLVVAMAAVVLLVVGSPWWGANWGGYVALAAGLMALWVGTSRRRGRAAALGAVALVAMALVPAALDLLRRSGDGSHIGAAAAALRSGQFGIIGDMVQRKILMNWRIAAGAGWWWAAAIVPLLAAQAFLRREGWARVCLAREPFLATGLASAVVTAGVAMVVNDSGVVSLATALAVAFGVLIFVAARAEMSPG
jgi:hypothetical protein